MTQDKPHSAQRLYASVMLDEGIDKELDYLVPVEEQSTLRPGARVTVPLRGGEQKGYVLALKSDSPFSRQAKELRALHADEESLPEELLELGCWMADYYCTPFRRVLRCLLPAAVRKGLKAQEQLFVSRNKSEEELRQQVDKLRHKAPNQAYLLHLLLKETQPVLLSEWLEKGNSCRSSADALIKKGLVALNKEQLDRSLLLEQEFFRTLPKQLTAEQHHCLEQISGSLEASSYATYLLFGVTGSGKTEVYLQAIEKALKLGKSAIFALPEIALTQQTIGRLRGRFEEKICILHHRLSEGERRDAWVKMRRGEVAIAVGARSVIFSPLPNLGLIVIDEEHDSSYKQGDAMPCYNARDVAIMRAYKANASVLLGSATPSLESYTNALNGKYRLLKLTQRADNAKLPTTCLIDMKREHEKAQGFTLFSQRLLNAIEERLTRGEQTILFLNRRGYHTTLLCQACGHIIKCRSCDSAMTFHRSEEHLCCHLCGFTLSPPPRECPSCKQLSTMKYRGCGTELVERSLHAIFPQARTLRIDADTTRGKDGHEKLLRQFATGKADLLVGTQMVAKGLHFPEVTLVGVLNGDGSLTLPDYRASEVTFQLLTQVAGRSGRGLLAGEVIIQSHLVDHSVMMHAARQDYERFYDEEAASRKMFGYPPFGHLVKVACSSVEEKSCYDYCEQLRQKICSFLGGKESALPTVAAAHAKVKERYRFQFILRGSSIAKLVEGCRKALCDLKPRGDLRCHIDVNPLTTFF